MSQIPLDSENSWLTCGISAEYISSTLLPVSFTLKFSFQHNPFLTFTAQKSNFKDAVKFGIREVNYILENFPDGQKMMEKNREKDIKTGAYQILN